MLVVEQGQKNRSLGFKLIKTENKLPDVIGDPRLDADWSRGK